MIEFRVNDHHVMLLPDTTVQMELVSPLFADGIEDSFSMPIDIPVRGSEIALGHVHELATKLRQVDIPNVRMEVDGAPLFTGDLKVQGSDASTINATFGIDALAVRIKGRMLPDLIKDLVIPIEQNGAVGDPNGLRPGFAYGGDCQFPMHYNPSLYGDANKDWFPSTQEWSATATYTVNALVTFTSYEQDAWHLERTTPWQCISNTYAGESPLTHPAKWKKTAYGIVNAWDHDASEFKPNTTDGNFYALVPWFYAKWLLKKALNAVGYAAIGDFMEDTRTDEVLIPNTATIDVPVTPSSTNFFQATDDHVVNYYIPGPFGVVADFRIHGSNETTDGNQDPDSLWNPLLHQWQCPAAGDYQFKVNSHFTMNVFAAWTVNTQLRGVVQKADGTVVASAPIHVDWAGYQTINGTVYRVTKCTGIIPATFLTGDIGTQYHFNVQIIEYGTSNVLWPATSFDKYIHGRVSGWLVDITPSVATPDSVIYPHRHVPNVQLSDWLIALAAAFNLSITPDQPTHSIRFDYRENTVTGITTGTPDETNRLDGPIAFDHTRDVLGMRLKWDLQSLTKEVVSTNETLPTYVSELELPLPLVADDRCLLLNTRQLLKSGFKGGDFFWKDTGYYLPDAVFGDPDNTTDTSPGIKPLHMQRHSIDGRDLMIPVLDAQGSSDFFHVEGTDNSMWMCMFVYNTVGPATVGGDVPTLENQGPQARSWGYAWHDYDPAPLALNWKMDNSAPLYATAITPYTEFYQKWMEAMVNAEPVTMDLRVDQPFILAKSWHKPLLLNYQRYLVQRLPLNYANTFGTVLAQEVQALRLREGVPDFVVPLFAPLDPSPDEMAFAPAGFNDTVSTVRYMSNDFVIVGGAFTASGATSLGRIAKLNPDGSLNSVFIFNSGSGFNNTVSCIEIQSDGKLVCGGQFTSYNGNSCGGIARLNTNGTFDPTFNASGAGLSGGIAAAAAMVTLADGTIVMVGSFLSYNGTATNGIVGINTDGSISSSFITGVGLGTVPDPAIVYDIALDNNNNVLVCGNFSRYKTVPCARIIRISATGDRDVTLSIPTIAYAGGGGALMNTMTVQADDKIVIAGGMSSYGGVSVNKMMRISNLGVLDTAFTAALGASMTSVHINSIIINSDGIIYAADTTAFYMIGVDGTVLPQSYLGTGPNDWVYRMIFNPSETRIFLVGKFTTINGASALRIYSFDL